MPISWKLIVGLFMIPYGAAAIFTAVMYQTTDIGNVADTNISDYKAFLNTAGQPQEVAIDQPGAGASNIPVSGQLSYSLNPVGWVTTLGNAVALRGPIWEPWTAPIRFVLYLMAAPAILMISIGMAQAASFFFGSIFGRVSP